MSSFNPILWVCNLYTHLCSFSYSNFSWSLTSSCSNTTHFKSFILCFKLRKWFIILVMFFSQRRLLRCSQMRVFIFLLVIPIYLSPQGQLIMKMTRVELQLVKFLNCHGFCRPRSISFVVVVKWQTLHIPHGWCPTTLGSPQRVIVDGGDCIFGRVCTNLSFKLTAFLLAKIGFSNFRFRRSESVV